MWNKDEMHGKADQMKGRMKKAAGKISGNERLRDEGAADDVVGKAEEGIGRGRRAVGNAIKDVGDRVKK